MQLDDSDVVGEGKTSARKREYQLYIKRVDGKYLFTVSVSACVCVCVCVCARACVRACVGGWV